ncbi:protein kinase [Acidobacteria bacterium AH-259-L09]|nr:protein kinase [Acidobacteria bacterium AH-259-L09]
MIGKTISHYRILEKLGEGGMGEVYRAEDTTLKRQVAIKVLPEQFTQDPQRLARFEREAQLLASLNHPNIAAIHSFEHADGLHFLVLELVEGETLAERLTKGPLPVEEALEVCRQIAEGVEAAHEKGVIHRDLKPANVKVTPEGMVKVLDFGLAKALQGEIPVTDISQSPTLTEEMTRAGVILGTAGYMSPEQARGKRVDKRADIFAFGAVLYELLAGKRAFDGDTITETLGAIIHKEPDWKALPGTTPWRIRDLLGRCLRKAVHDRLDGIANVRIEINMALSDPTTVSPMGVSGTGQPPLWTRAIPWSIAAVVVVIAAIMLWSDAPITRNVQPVTRAEITLPLTSPLGFGATFGFDPTLIALSPDGTTLVFVGKTGEGTQLYLRAMDSLEITPIAGTEGAWHPFFSPDSNWVGFLTQDRVKKISLRGGGPITLCQAPTLIQATWTHDDMIYFGSNVGAVLNSVPASGGEPKLIVDLGYFPSDDRPNVFGQLNEILPDGQSALVTVIVETSISADSANIYALSLQTLEKTLLIGGGYDARYVPSGHLLFARTGVLMAVPFDLERLEVQGEPQVVLKGVGMESLFAHVQVSFSDTGTLVYSPGGNAAVGRIARVDRQGKTELLSVPERVYGVFDLSPNDQQLAVQVADVNDYVWIYDLPRGEGRRLVGTGPNGWPKWNTNGDRIAFLALGGVERSSIIERRFDTQEERELIAGDYSTLTPTDWSPDGSILSFSDWSRGTIGFVSTGRQPEVNWLEPPPGVRYWATAFSPDGRWVAYNSNETGQYEIWIRSFPDGDQVQQISTEGGIEPVWIGSGELFYHSGHRWMVVRVSTSPQLQWEPPQLAFETEYVDTPGISYDVSSDGRYLYVVKSAHPPDPTRLYVVQNWFEELKRLVPTGE